MQQGVNDEALERASRELSQATTRDDINAALSQLEAEYRVRGPAWRKKESAVIARLKTYYLPSV